MTIALAFTHASHLPERKDSFLRLGLALGDPPGPNKIFGGAEPRAAWSEAQWAWALSTKADHCLFIQDDVRVAPDFWPSLRAMLEAKPEELISLYSNHLASRILARTQTAAWYTLSDAVGGPIYAMPRAVLHDAMVWRAKSLHDGAPDYLAEDDTLALFCMATGRRCHYPVVSIADHDAALESSFGFAPSPFRRSAVTWADVSVLGLAAGSLSDAAHWKGATVHLGKMREVMPYHARTWVKGWTEAQTRRTLADRCPPEYDVQRWELKA